MASFDQHSAVNKFSAPCMLRAAVDSLMPPLQPKACHPLLAGTQLCGLSVLPPRRLKVAALLAPQPDPKLMITDGREKTDGFGTTGQAPSTLVLWKHEPKNALFYDSASREGLPFSGEASIPPALGACTGIGAGCVCANMPARLQQTSRRFVLRLDQLH